MVKQLLFTVVAVTVAILIAGAIQKNAPKMNPAA
jgi:hypothetical protein